MKYGTPLSILLDYWFQDPNAFSLLHSFRHETISLAFSCLWHCFPPDTSSLHSLTWIVYMRDVSSSSFYSCLRHCANFLSIYLDWLDHDDAFLDLKTWFKCLSARFLLLFSPSLNYPYFTPPFWPSYSFTLLWWWLRFALEVGRVGAKRYNNRKLKMHHHDSWEWEWE